MKHVKSFSDAQLKTEFDKIRTAAADLQSQNIRSSSTTVRCTKQWFLTPTRLVPGKKRLGRIGCSILLTLPFLLKTGVPEADTKCALNSPEVNDGSEVWKNQNTWNIQSWKLYSYSGVHVLEIVGGLVIHMFVDKKYPLSVNLIERMLDHQLEICQDTVGNELTTAVQLIAFLKTQIADSRRPKVHDSSCFDADFLVADSKFMKVAFGDGFKMLLFNPLVCSTKDLSRNLKLTVSNSSLGEDC
ncbi:hypothetical protein Tco_0411908 [Tanacetum coccineum]